MAVEYEQQRDTPAARGAAGAAARRRTAARPRRRSPATPRPRPTPAPARTRRPPAAPPTPRTLSEDHRRPRVQATALGGTYYLPIKMIKTKQTIWFQFD